MVFFSCSQNVRFLGDYSKELLKFLDEWDKNSPKSQFSKNIVRCIIKETKEGDILNTAEQTRQQDLERIKLFRYMDDDFMTACLEDNIEGVELILQIVLGRKDITIKSVRTQKPLKNLQGRSAVLDVHAVESTKKKFDVDRKSGV